MTKNIYSDRYEYYDPFIKGIKTKSFEISKYKDRYYFSFPQILAIDERYISLFGGTQKNV
jgi:hypothetical protein